MRCGMTENDQCIINHVLKIEDPRCPHGVAFSVLSVFIAKKCVMVNGVNVNWDEFGFGVNSQTLASIPASLIKMLKSLVSC